ncbi:MAG TPA: (2Fe-2S)-binding protein [Holophagaceae bacterium]|nr:(2Fe-2S)-binding protein [Holophagaceae bacterium]
MIRSISFRLNGRPVTVKAEEGRALLWILRYELGLTGTKYGCGEALCGTCTVLLDGEAVRACSTLLKQAAGREVLTIEGLASDGRLHGLQQAFLDHHAFQCGYCTPGMILNAYALLRKVAHPTREQIIQHMDGNLCRCGSHVRILDAIEAAAGAGAAAGSGAAR